MAKEAAMFTWLILPQPFFLTIYSSNNQLSMQAILNLLMEKYIHLLAIIFCSSQHLIYLFVPAHRHSQSSNELIHQICTENLLFLHTSFRRIYFSCVNYLFYTLNILLLHNFFQTTQSRLNLINMCCWLNLFLNFNLL